MKLFKISLCICTREFDKKFLNSLKSLDKKFLINYIKFIKKKNCEIVIGPKFYLSKKKYFKVLERNFKDIQVLKWASSNNIFFKKKILENNIYFSNRVTKYRFGEDQLFFNQQNRKDNLIKLSNNKVKIYGIIQKDREQVNLFLYKSFKFGLTGFLRDINIYECLNSSINKLGKIVYYLYLIILSYFINFFNPNLNVYNITFNLFRILGQIIGIKNII